MFLLFNKQNINVVYEEQHNSLKCASIYNRGTHISPIFLQIYNKKKIKDIIFIVSLYASFLYVVLHKTKILTPCEHV